MAAWGLSTVHDKSMATHKPPEGVLLHCQPNPHSFLQPLARWSPCPALHGVLTDSALDGDPFGLGAPAAVVSSGLDLDAILRFEWRGSIAGQTLTAAELHELAEAKRPIVRVRGRWVVADPRLAERLAGRRPAVLVEMGYSSSPSDAKYMTSKDGQRKIARALADAIVDYLLEFEWKSGVRAGGPGR